MNPTPLPRPAPRVAVLGVHAANFAKAVSSSLAQRLGTDAAGALEFHVSSALAASGEPDADLRWLLAWEGSPTEDPQADLDALHTQQALRRALHAQGLPYQVLRGPQEDRVTLALWSLVPWWPELARHLPTTGERSRRPGVLSCDRCGDPACEHRSFTALLEQRASASR